MRTSYARLFADENGVSHFQDVVGATPEWRGGMWPGPRHWPHDH